MQVLADSGTVAETALKSLKLRLSNPWLIIRLRLMRIICIDGIGPRASGRGSLARLVVKDVDVTGRLHLNRSTGMQVSLDNLKQT